MFKNKRKDKKDIKDIKLKDIYVGRANGLKEASEKNFENMFYKGNHKYQELTSDLQKFIISGKKGTGKTILAKYFQYEEIKKGHPTVFLTEREAKLSQFMECGKLIDDPKELELFIEYSVYCELGKVILKNWYKVYIKSGIHLVKIHKYMKYLQKIIFHRNSIDNYYKCKLSTTENHETEMAGSYAAEKGNEFYKVNNETCGKYTRSNSQNIDYGKNPFYNLIEPLKSRIDYILNYINVNVIYDDLDEYDDIITENKSFVHFFKSFIKIVDKINTDNHISEKKCSRVIILMRSDMMDPLSNNDKNIAKIFNDCQVKLNWIKKVRDNSIHPLIEMILVKIRNSDPALYELTNEQIMSRFFPKKIKGIEFTSYVLNTTFGRPRDIINMLNSIKEEHPDYERFTSKSFTNTKLEYSEKMLAGLRNEMATHYVGELIDECFNIISQIGKYEFWLSDIEKVFALYDIKYFAEPKVFYDICYRFGILGNVWENEDNKRSYSWKYREDGRKQPNPNEKFCVHFALTKKLIG